jgi:hypothetical protein
LRPIYHYASLGGETIRDLIFYEYAKLIARSAGFAGNYAFIMKKYTELREGRLAWSNLTREHRKELERGKSCAYCGSPRNIGFHHIIPLSKGGTDTPDNLVASRASCNISKGDRDLYEWWVNTLHRDEDTLPRIVARKYLKLIYDIHKEHSTQHTWTATANSRCST